MNRKSIGILLVALLLLISTSIMAYAVLSAPSPPTPDTYVQEPDMEGLAFIKDVLPIDTSKYNITIDKQIPSLDNNVTYLENYSLKSEKGILSAHCTYQNNILQFCLLYVNSGSAILKDTYPNTIDAAAGFLLKYQDYTKIDSKPLINMLQGINSTEDRQLTSGNLTLSIRTGEFPKGTQTTSFSWKYVLNGCEYTGLSINFDNGTFGGFSDSRALYTIGNTTVNVSMKKAVDIARERIKSYSYEMPGDIWIKDFNISGTGAELRSSIREPYVLHPFWQVRLYLDKQYPGSVTNLLVHVWADTGEVFYCYHDSTGHKDY